MSKETIGTCSLCGGRVTLPLNWLSVNPPIPTCDHCGAIKDEMYGGVIKMRPRLVGIKTQYEYSSGWGLP